MLRNMLIAVAVLVSCAACGGSTVRIKDLEFVSIELAKPEQIPDRHSDFDGRNDVLLLTFSTRTDLRAAMREIDSFGAAATIRSCSKTDKPFRWYTSVRQNGLDILGSQPVHQNGQSAEYSVLMRYAAQWSEYEELTGEKLDLPYPPEDLCMQLDATGYGPVARKLDSSPLIIPKAALLRALEQIPR